MRGVEVSKLELDACFAACCLRPAALTLPSSVASMINRKVAANHLAARGIQLAPIDSVTMVDSGIYVVEGWISFVKREPDSWWK